MHVFWILLILQNIYVYQKFGYQIQKKCIRVSEILFIYFFEMWGITILGNYKVCFTSYKVSNPNGGSLKIKISCCICLWVLFLLLCASLKWIYFIWSHHIRIFIYTSFAESAFMFLTLTLLFFFHSFFQRKNKYERHHKCIFSSFCLTPR